MTTKRQKAAVRFCEEVLNIKYEGNIDNHIDVSYYLSLYLDDAKMIMDEARESYYSNFWY